MFKLTLFLVCFTFALDQSLEHVITQDTSKIVGGHPVEIEDYPCQAAVHYKSIQICGGSIISNKVILTAAHCAYDRDPQDFKVRVGSIYRNKGGQFLQVEKSLLHPLYDDFASTTDYDVSLLFLKSPIEPCEEAAPIKLAQKEVPAGTMGTVTGWGSFFSGGHSPDNLHGVEIPTISREECQKMYPKEKISDNMICAGYPEGKKDSCQGDSGGPYVAEGILIGVVSWGYGCADYRYPGVYANVAILRPWIIENVDLKIITTAD